MANVLNERYIGSDECARFRVAPLSNDSGFFRWGPGLVCYGRSACGFRSRSCVGQLYDVSHAVQVKSGYIQLPFDPDEVVDNLRRERYTEEQDGQSVWLEGTLRRLYYQVRPLLSVNVRKYIQRLYASGWRKFAFPAWPVDTTVENLQERLMSVALRASGVERVPFIWFWPDGFSASAVLTHDVETATGKAFCSRLMDLNDSYGIKSSFQVVPERRYELSPGFLESLRCRGFEVNIHDLNHDGRLFSSRTVFIERVGKINAYAREFAAAGFRSAVLYRNQDWLNELEFEYDMSVPNVGHLDPQRGGCCTVMPYFVGNLMEMPLTTTQDYMLFHLLNDYSMDLWTKQIELVLAKNGLISFLVHPDYVNERRAQKTYESLLKRLAEMRSQMNLWIALPKQISDWWRQRSQMKLVRRNGRWEVDGSGNERARVAYASLQNDRLVYSIESPASMGTMPRSGN